MNRSGTNKANMLLCKLFRLRYVSETILQQRELAANTFHRWAARAMALSVVFTVFLLCFGLYHQFSIIFSFELLTFLVSRSVWPETIEL